ncbi:MAG: hypothetical protein Fur0021_22810 [Candidatus Promineifilaceae bacterium]
MVDVGRYVGGLVVALLFLVGCSQDAPLATLPATLPLPTLTLTPVVGVAFVTVAPPTVAVIQTTPTPLPTPTETPTPTPIAYQVVEGDTIWVIAAKSYRTVDEILALNPDVRPNLLQIGQTLLLPPPATPVFQNTGSTPAPIRVTVVSVTPYQTPLGGLWLLGEVVNEGEMPAQNLQLTLELLDSAGQTIYTTTAWVVASLLPPQQRAPFGVLLPQRPPDFASTRVSVTGGDTAVDRGTRYLDLAVKVDAAVLDETQATLEGQIENVGEAAAGQILLAATLYDAQGRVTGYHQAVFDEVLPAGSRLPFAFSAAPPGGRTVTYQLFAQGLQVTP